MTSTKFFDAFSLVVTRGHSWSLVVNSWSLVVTRGHSWQEPARGHSWSLVVTRGHSCVLLDTTILTNLCLLPVINTALRVSRFAKNARNVC